jgi:hypothetical protein
MYDPSHVSVYVRGTLITLGLYLDSRTNLILKGGDDVMKCGRTSLLMPL